MLALVTKASNSGIKKFILTYSIDKTKTEQTNAENELISYFKSNDLVYTIIHVTKLKSEPATGNGILTKNTNLYGTINEDDLADLVCYCLHSIKAKNRVFSAIDGQELYTQLGFVDFELG